MAATMAEPNEVHRGSISPVASQRKIGTVVNDLRKISITHRLSFPRDEREAWTSVVGQNEAITTSFRCGRKGHLFAKFRGRKFSTSMVKVNSMRSRTSTGTLSFMIFDFFKVKLERDESAFKMDIKLTSDRRVGDLRHALAARLDISRSKLYLSLHMGESRGTELLGVTSNSQPTWWGYSDLEGLKLDPEDVDCWSWVLLDDDRLSLPHKDGLILHVAVSKAPLREFRFLNEIPRVNQGQNFVRYLSLPDAVTVAQLRAAVGSLLDCSPDIVWLSHSVLRQNLPHTFERIKKETEERFDPDRYDGIQPRLWMTFDDPEAKISRSLRHVRLSPAPLCWLAIHAYENESSFDLLTFEAPLCDIFTVFDLRSAIAERAGLKAEEIFLSRPAGRYFGQLAFGVNSHAREKWHGYCLADGSECRDNDVTERRWQQLEFTELFVTIPGWVNVVRVSRAPLHSFQVRTHLYDIARKTTTVSAQLPLHQCCNVGEVKAVLQEYFSRYLQGDIEIALSRLVGTVNGEEVFGVQEDVPAGRRFFCTPDGKELIDVVQVMWKKLNSNLEVFPLFAARRNIVRVDWKRYPRCVSRELVFRNLRTTVADIGRRQYSTLAT